MARAQKSNPNESAERFYYPQLDGLRSIAFLLVFSTHAGWSFLPFAWAGVDLFFILSAFLITSILLREEDRYGSIDLRKFLFRRALRIWPLYFVALAFGLLTFPFATVMASPEIGSPSYWNFINANVLWNSTFLMNNGMAMLVMSTPPSLTPLWSISLEEQFYLLWGVAFLVARSLRSRTWLIVLLLGLTIYARHYLQSAFPSSHVPFYFFTLARLDPLLFGAAVAIALHTFPGLLRRLEGLGLWFFAGAMAILIGGKLTFEPGMFVQSGWNAWQLSVVALGFGLLFLAALTWRPLTSALSGNLVGKFGRLTFGMYVAHAFVFQALERFVHQPLGNTFGGLQFTAINWIVGLPLVVGTAILTWRFIEQPALRLKSKFEVIPTGRRIAALQDYAGTVARPN